MAFPVIKIDSTDGGASDSACSGAGPATALTGTNASYSSDVVSFNESVDLSGVLDTGAHVLYLVTSSTNVKFFKITAVDDGANTVTVTPSPAGTSSGLSWAIGGKRASIGSATSLPLVTNNAGVGDWKPGWWIQLQPGHTETLSTQFDLWSSDAIGDGYHRFGGTGSGTTPVLTWTNNGNGIAIRTSGAAALVSDVTLVNTNATKTASIGIVFASGAYGIIERVRIDDATNKFWKGITCSAGTPIGIDSCKIGNTASHAIEIANVQINVRNCDIGPAAGVGIKSGGSTIACIHGNLIHECDSGGAELNWNTAASAVGGMKIFNNTFDDNDSHGLEFTDSGARTLYQMEIHNNIFSNNNGNGILWHGSTTTPILQGYGVSVKGNVSYNNVSGFSNLTGFDEGTTTAIDPDFPGSGDYTPAAALKGKGYPGVLPIGRYGATYSYIDPGAAQREEAGGGGSVQFVPVE